MTTTTTTTNNFPQLLKAWRAKCGVSQLELSLRCDVSQRHISFLESARSSPSKFMVMLICQALNVPLRDRNSLLLAAGLAPAYQESLLTEPDLKTVDQALTMILTQQEPFPAIVLDRLFNIIRANQAAMTLQTFLFGVENSVNLPAVAGNILKSLFYPEGYRAYVKNWNDVAPCLLRQLHAEAFTKGDSEDLVKLLGELEQCEGVPENWRQHLPGDWLSPIMTVDIKRDDVELRLFSTIATLGTPLDVTLQEIRIESYFPADDATRKFFMTPGWRC